MEERRKFKRLEVKDIKNRCFVEGTQESFSLDIKDITPNGIGFLGAIDVAQNTDLKIILNINDVDVCCRVRVCWIKPDEFSDFRYGGMQITDISQEAKSLLLIKYTNDLLSLYPDPGIVN